MLWAVGDQRAASRIFSKSSFATGRSTSKGILADFLFWISLDMSGMRASL
jgi:hypothetical protein